MYITVTAIMHKLGIYALLVKVFGAEDANALVDLAIYSMVFRDNSFHIVKDRDCQFLNFSHSELSDTYISTLLNNRIKINDIELFKQLWMDLCLSNCTVKILIGGDGSNDDCKSQSDLAQKGHAKSAANVNIVGFFLIVDANSNDPITFEVGNGSKPDCKYVSEITKFLESYNVNIEAIVLDRNFCNNNVIKELDSCGIPYVIMVPSDVYGHKLMVDKHAQNLMDNPDLIIDDGLSGITEKTQIFKNNEYEAYINLIYDDVNGAKRRDVFRKKIYEEKKRLEKLISEGKNPDVSKELSKYIEINEGKNVNIIHENYIEELQTKGMSSILTKENYGAAEAQKNIA